MHPCYKNTCQLSSAAPGMVLPPFAKLPSAAISAGRPAAQLLHFIRHLPVAGPLYPIMLPPLPLRHNAKVEPAGSCPAACRPSSVQHGRPHGGRWRALHPRPVVPPSRVLRCHYMQRQSCRRPPAISSGIKPDDSNAVGGSICRHKSPAAPRLHKRPNGLLYRQPERWFAAR